MANEFDYFPFFLRLFMADTADMSTAGIGAYMLLLVRAWDEKPVGTIPTDDETLSRWTRLSAIAWSSVKPEVLSRFQPLRPGETRYTQKKMRKVYETLRRMKKDKSDVNRAAAKARWDREKDANALHPQCERIPTETETQMKLNNRQTDAAVGVLSGDCAGADIPGVSARLRSVGVDAPIAHRLAQTTPMLRVEQVIAAGMARVRKGKIREGKLGGYVRAAIERNYAVPSVKPSPAKVAAESKKNHEKSLAERQTTEEKERADDALIASIPPDELAAMVKQIQAELPHMAKKTIDSPAMKWIVVTRARGAVTA